MQILCLFPGQGSQQRDFFEKFEGTRCAESAREAKARLEKWLEKHSQPDNIQAHIVGTSLWAFEQLRPYLKEHDIWVGGHSLGEVTATSINLGWSWEETLALAQKREELMHSCCPEGAEVYAVLGKIERNKIASLCNPVHGPWLMNDNSWEQVVIGGYQGTGVLLEGLGAKRILRLPMGVLSHCIALEPMCAVFQKHLPKIVPLHAPLYPQRLCRTLETTTDAETLVNNLVQQLVEPVRFREMIESLQALSWDAIIEVGPGSVLSGLVKKIAPELPVLKTSSGESLEEVLGLLEKELIVS
jgi:[acyl-carrier-protein] S-malonyltransferase